MTESEAEVRKLAKDQLGLVARRQLLDRGLSEAAVKRWARRSGWRTVDRGVYLLGVSDPTWQQRVLSACLFAGTHAAASHRAGAVVWGLDGLVRAPVEIMVPHGEEATMRGVVVHRSRKFDDTDRTRRGAIPVTTVERTLLDAARYLEARELEKAVDSAIRMNLATPQTMWGYLNDRGGAIPGHRALRRVLLERGAAPAAGSGGEIELLRLLRAAGLPEPVRQHPVVSESGRRFFLDFAWPGVLLGLEYDGYDSHGGRAAHAADLERQNCLVSGGWTLLRYPGSRVRRDPLGVVREVSAAYGRAAELSALRRANATAGVLPAV